MRKLHWFIVAIWMIFQPIALPAIPVDGEKSALLQEEHPGFTKRALNKLETEALNLARLQLKGYINRDIETFLSAYADNVKVFTFPGKLNYEGKEEMRKVYAGMFERTPLLHCTITSEIVQGNKVIHEESVIFNDPDKPVHAVAIYIIEQGKIAEVYFLPRMNDN